jgi:hypothetical protein
LKQWKKLEEGKQKKKKKTVLLIIFLNLKDVLRHFANIIKE